MSKEQVLHPTYYVRHPDDSYSVADPQPIYTQKPLMFLFRVREEGQNHRIFKDALEPSDDASMWTALYSDCAP